MPVAHGPAREGVRVAPPVRADMNGTSSIRCGQRRLPRCAASEPPRIVRI